MTYSANSIIQNAIIMFIVVFYCLYFVVLLMLTFNLFSGIIDDEFDDDDVTPPRSPLVVQNSNMGLSSKPLLLRPADNSPFTTGTFFPLKYTWHTVWIWI